MSGPSYAEMLGIGLATSPVHGKMPKNGRGAPPSPAIPVRAPDFSIADEGAVDPHLAAALAAKAGSGPQNIFDQFDVEAVPAADGTLMAPAVNPMAAEKPVEANPFDQFDVDAPSEVAPSVLSDVLASAGTGLARGAAGLAGLPGDVLAWGSRAVGAAEEGLGFLSPEDRPAFERGLRKSLPIVGDFPTSGEIKDAATALTGQTLYEPKTRAGRYAETVGEFVPAALGGSGSIAGRLTKFAVVPGIASEAAGEATEGTDLEPYARMVAAIGTGGAAQLLSRHSTAAQAVRQQLPKGMTDVDVAKASNLMQLAQSRGVALTWPEVLQRVTKGRVDLTDLQRWLEQARGSRPVISEFMAERPTQARAAMDAELGSMPSAAGDPVTAGLRVQGQSTAALTKLRKRINSVTESLYRQGGQATVHPRVMAGLSRDPLFQSALKSVRTDPVFSRLVGNAPDDSVAVFDAVKKVLDDLAGSAGKEGRNAAAAVYGNVAGDVRNAARSASPEYGQALDRQAQLRGRLLKPAEAGPLGKMAETSDLQRQGRTLLPANPAAGSERVVKQTVLRLARQDPNAALQLIGTHLADAFNEATQALTSGPNQWGAAKFVAKIIGNAQQEKNLQAAVESLPGGRIRWAGMRKLFEVFAATGARQRPGSGTEFNRMLSEEMTRGGVAETSGALAMSPGKALTYVHDFWRNFKLGRNAEAMARIITSPTSEPLFRKLLSAKTLTDRQRAAGVLIYDALESPRGASSRDGSPAAGYQ